MYSTYMPWAKLESGAKYKLAISDVDLGYIPPLDRAKLALSGPITHNGRYGYAPLLQAMRQAPLPGRPPGRHSALRVRAPSA